VEDQRDLLSAAERDMIGLAVPERRKSASLTELMKESCRTGGVGQMRLRGWVLLAMELDEKWRVTLKGRGGLVGGGSAVVSYNERA